MLFWILFTAMLALTTLAVFNACDIEDGVFRFVMVGIIGTVLMGTIMATIGFLLPTHKGDVETSELQAITTTSGPAGSFFLGSGSFKEEPAYFYYRKNAEGFVMDSISPDNVTVIESDGTPRLEKTCLDLPSWYMPFKCFDEEIRIYVPAGSVKPMVNMDLPN